MQCKYQDYNFPTCPPAASHRQPFSNYSPSLVDVSNNAVLNFLRREPDKVFERAYPIVPLSEGPTDVPYPYTDRVMGEIIKKNKLLSSFIPHISRVIGQRKKSTKNEELCKLLQTMEDLKCSPSGNGQDIADNISPWFEDLLKQYESVVGIKELQSHNSLYAGGCLAFLPREDNIKGILMSPSGAIFDTINVHSVFEDSSGIIRSRVIARETAPGTIYEVKGQKVHSECKLAIRLEGSCLIYSVDDANTDSPLTLLYQTEQDSLAPTSVNLRGLITTAGSLVVNRGWIQFLHIRRNCIHPLLTTSVYPYLTEECLVATEQGQCYLWTENCFEEVIQAHSSRFETAEKWCHAHFGSHPRQIVFSDPTVIQMYDLREPSSVGHDLFALPSKMLHQKERIRMSQCYHRNLFYQVIATDYTLMLVDERFPQHPVLKWDHMLSTPPQYITCLDHMSGCEDSAVFVGSQVPSEVHAFRFTIRGDNPPQAMSLPRRVDRMRDILKNPTVTENISHVTALEERFHSSLVGLQASPWGNGHVVLQLDSHGDIFAQAFQRKEHQDEVSSEVENTAGLVARRWVEELESQIKQYLNVGEHAVAKDVTCIFNDIQYSRPASTSCSLCLPSTAEVLEQSHMHQDAECLKCMHMVETGNQLVKTVQEDTILPRSGSCDLPSRCGLVDVNKLPSTSALSRLLLKQWKKDTDIDSELKDWDEEVLEYRKHRRKQKREKGKDMTEEAVLSRLFGKSSGTSCSSPQLPVQEASVLDSIASADELDKSLTGDTRRELGNTETDDISAVADFVESTDQMQEPETVSCSDSAKSQSDFETEAEKTSSPSLTRKQGYSDPLAGKTGSPFRSPSVGVKRKRHSSERSSSSVKSHLSMASTVSSPGFLTSPKYLRPCQRTSLSPSAEVVPDNPFKKQLSFYSEKDVHSESLDKNSKSVESDKSARLEFPGTEFSVNLFAESQSLFSSPVRDRLYGVVSSPRKYQGSPINYQGNTPKLKRSLSSSKVRKKSMHQPGF